MSTVQILNSTRPRKKYMAIFIYETDGKKKKKTIHFGAANSKDYIFYHREKGKKFAEERKRLYYARHVKREDWTKPMTAGTLSKYILWNKPTINESIKDYVKKFKFEVVGVAPPHPAQKN